MKIRVERMFGEVLFRSCDIDQARFQPTACRQRLRAGAHNGLRRSNVLPLCQTAELNHLASAVSSCRHLAGNGQSGRAALRFLMVATARRLRWPQRHVARCTAAAACLRLEPQPRVATDCFGSPALDCGVLRQASQDPGAAPQIECNTSMKRPCCL